MVESQEIRVVYSSTFEEYLTDSVIDYADDFYGRGFYIRGSGLSSC